MKTNENPKVMFQKQEECILSQKALIEQMNEVISVQAKEIDYLKQLSSALQEENSLLNKFNEEIMDIFHRMSKEQ